MICHFLAYVHTYKAALTVPRRAVRWYVQQFPHIRFVVVLFVFVLVLVEGIILNRGQNPWGPKM